MHKWRVDVILNNGASVSGVYEGDQSSFGEVIRILLGNGKENSFMGLRGNTPYLSNLVIRISDVSAITLSIVGSEEKDD